VVPTIMTTSVFQLNFSSTQVTETVNDDDDIIYDVKTVAGGTDPQRTSNGFTLSLTDPE